MARKRRGRDEGSVFQRSDGRWVARLSLGYGTNGRRKQRTVYGATKKEVQEKLLKLQGQKATGTISDPSRQTVSEYLDSWIENDVRPNRADKTTDRYEVTVRLHLKPRIGRMRLQSLSPQHVQAMLGEMLRDKVSADTRKKTLAILKAALNRAVKLQLIVRNPCLGVEAPKVKRRDIRPLTAEQSAKLFEVSADHRLGAVFVLATTTGLRRGELFGLHWSDVNLSEGVLTIRRNLSESRYGLRLKEPKSQAGRRAVMLPAMAVDALRRRREIAAAEGLADCELVFPDRVGGFLRGSNFQRQVWYRFRAAAGISETVSFHDLRHTAASLLLSQNVHPKVVQERLGHSDIGLTLNTYSHLMPGMQAEAAGLLDELFAKNEYTLSTQAEMKADQPVEDWSESASQ